MSILNAENLIDDWRQTIGLTIARIEEFTIQYDDAADHTIIIFTNDKFVIQRDQSYYTTSCGLLSVTEAVRYEHEILKILK